MITVMNVSKRFGRVAAVDDISFEIQPGQALALWGSNGAGKTTLIRCLLGVLRFDGSIHVNDANVRKRGKLARSHIGYVPQELSFHEDTRVAGALSFFAGLRRSDLRRCTQLLDQVGLGGQDRKRLRDLSGGMKQRLALAVAMLSDPPVIVLDEPTSNLDSEGRSEVVRALKVLKDEGKTILFASHRADEVMALAARVLVLDAGRLKRDTTPAEMWSGADQVRTMRLCLADASEAAAAQILRDAGHAVNLNGRGLCVNVAQDQKASPFRDLARAQIVVRDFELLEDYPQPEQGS